MGKGFVIVVLPSYSAGTLKVFDGERFTTNWADVRIFSTIDAALGRARWLSRIHPVDVLRVNVSLGQHVGTVRPDEVAA